VSSTVNYVAEAYNDVRCAPSCAITTTTPIYVVAGATTIVNFGLSPGATVSGVVTDEVTLAPLSSIGVFLIDPNGFTFFASTNASGAYTVNGVPPGTYYSQTSAPSTYLNELYNNIPCNPFCPNFLTGTPITVTGTTPVTGINYSLPPAAAAAPGGISGVVSVATVPGPVVAVPNTTVQIFNSTGSQIRSVLTDGSGNYNVTGVAAGTYYARTSVPTNVNAVDEAFGNIPCVPCPTITSTMAITVGTTNVTANFPLAAGGSITGAVVDQTTFVGLNSSVSVLAPSGQFVKTVPVDIATGSWTATGLPTGSYLARTNLSSTINYIPEAYNNIPCLPCPSTSTWTLIGVSGTATTPNINFFLAPGGAVSGTVTDARTGAPGPFVNIQIFSSTGVFVKSGSADINGNYSVVGLPTGVHYARTSFSSTYVVELYNNIPCPYNACSVLSGAALGVAQGGTVSGINFALLPAGAADIVVNFGAPYGLWRLGSDHRWQSIHALSPLATATGDFDGNGHEDLAVNFGPGVGVYAWMNHASWQLIHPASPTQMAAGDLDNNGRDDLIVVFAGYGVWRWVDTGAFNQVHGADASRIAVGDIDGAGADDLVLDFPGAGLWLLLNNTSFSALHALNTTTLVVADINGNGLDDVIVGLVGAGLWAYRDNTTWGFLHGANPVHTVAGRLDTNTGEDLVVDFGAPYGMYSFRNNGSTWALLHPASAQSISMADRTANLIDEVFVDFGAPYGLWQLRDNNTATGWSVLHGGDPLATSVGRFK
jgi:hypothetical protein